MLHHLDPSNAPKYVSKRRAADRYGKNQRTITRWTKDPKLGFPQPVMINGRWYFEEAELEVFERRLAAARLRNLAGCCRGGENIAAGCVEGAS